MRIAVSLILFFIYQYLAAQVFDNISVFATPNGLSNNSITCLEKDEDGFLWIGTHEGLNQFDGTEFIAILSNPRNNLPSNTINKICCVNKTTLAISTQDGLCFLNTKTGEGKKIEQPDINKSGDHEYIAWDILYDKKEKELWVATAEGIFVLTDEGALKRKMEANRDDQVNGVFAWFLFKDKSDYVFFYSQKRIGFFYPDFESQQLLPLEANIPDFPLNNLTKINYILRGATYMDDQIICCFSNTNIKDKKNILAYYNNATGNSFIDSFSSDKIHDQFIYKGFPVSDSVLLINSYFGEPLCYNLNTHVIASASTHPLWFTSWPDGIDAKLLVDKENIWAATQEGLLQIPQPPDIFRTNANMVSYINANPSLIRYNYGLYHDHKLWLSCQGTGVFSLDNKTNEIQQVFDNNTELKYQRKIICNDMVVMGDDLWVFSVYGPVSINTSTLKLNDIEAKNKDPLFDDKASFPYKDSKGNLWVSLPNGIAKYSVGTNSFTEYKNKGSGGEFPLQKAYFKTEDGHGHMWFARQDTLVKFDSLTQSFSTHFLKKDGLAIRPVQGMASDGGDILYMYLKGAFAIYHISTGAIDLFTKQTGIVSTYINQMVTDKSGNPWIATEGGLVYYNHQTGKFYSYTKADGLPDDNISSINFTDEHKDQLILGFTRSYCLFNPDILLQKRNSELLNTITGVEVNGNAIAFDEEKNFSYGDNNISFYYTGINFAAGQQNSYQYMLEGFDETWKYAGKKRQCNYINLPPGRYTFLMKSANQQGEWNETPASFSFSIAAPFWQTWWFRAFAVIMSIALIYGFIKRRDRIKEMENKVALQMSELKLTALQSQMNPHFIFNSLNSIQNYIMQQKPLEAARYLSKFSNLMRRVLDQSFNNLTPLTDIVETLKMYMELEAFRFSNEFTWQVNVDDAAGISDMKLPPLLLQPYVENAIIHGLMPKEGEKNLLIHLFTQNNELHCIIDDNGIGRGNKLTDTEGHISRGQKLTTDMLATMKQLLHADARINIIDKKDAQNNPIGTTIDLIIPLNT